MDQFRDQASVVIVDSENNIDTPIEVDEPGAQPDETIAAEIDYPPEEESGADAPETAPRETTTDKRGQGIETAGRQAVQAYVQVPFEEPNSTDLSGPNDTTNYQNPNQVAGQAITAQAGGGEKEPPKTSPTAHKDEDEPDNNSPVPHRNGTTETGYSPKDIDVDYEAWAITPIASLPDVTTFRIEADRPFEAREEGRNPFEQVLDRARETENVEGDIVTPSSVLHLEVRRSEDGATIRVGDLHSWEEGIGFGLNATVDREGVAEFSATTKNQQGEHPPDMPQGTRAEFIRASLALFEDTGHHVHSIRAVWAEGQSDQFRAFEQALGEMNDLHQATSLTPAGTFYRTLGFGVSDVTIKNTDWGRVATVTFDKKNN